MEFASKYVYNYDSSDEESVSDEEFYEGMSLTDSDSDGEVESEAGSAKDSVDSTRAGPSSPEEAAVRQAAIPLPPPPALMDAANAEDNPAQPPGSPAEKGTGTEGGSALGRLFSRLSKKGVATKSAPAEPPKANVAPKSVRHWKRAHQSGALLSTNTTSTTDAQAVHRKRYRRADTNVASIKFDTLISPSHMHTGDAVYCSGCKAILSHVSKLEEDGDNKVWACEFCGERNLLDIMEEEIPATADVTFMLEPAVSTTASGPSGTDESLVVFCVDVSGSMCVTTQVPGRLHLRGSQQERMQAFNSTREDQHLPGERRNVTYISRLQAMQAAVDHQIGELARNFPQRRAALISFNNEVDVIGDGTQTAVCISGDKLNDKEALVKAGSDLTAPKPVKDSSLALGQKIFGLEEGGATALGPALTVAVAMASQCPGSKVIVCTDGMANVGLGSLENLNSEEDMERAGDFYTNLGQSALSNSVSISVISITGGDCKLAHLGQVAEATGGQVNIVDPLKLTQEFSTILADRVIATNVVATFLLHKALYIRDEDQETEESRAVRVVGNVTTETQVTFEYGVRRVQGKKTDPAKGTKTDSTPEGEAQEGTSADADAGACADAKSEKKEGPVEYPFQLQIQYTDTEGAKALRVFTQGKPVTHDRVVAEREVNLGVLGTHTAQTSAQLALAGAYSKSRGVALMNQRLAWRYRENSKDQNSKEMYEKIFGNVQKMENRINLIQKKERSTRGCTYSDEEFEEYGDKPEVPPRSTKKLKATRTTECPDDIYAGLYHFRHTNAAKLSKK